MRLLDLFCGAGGASMGYSRAGFEVFGIDWQYQHRYPFEFKLQNAFKISIDFLQTFDLIHASPPCQAYIQRNKNKETKWPRLIEPTRELLKTSGIPYIIENVPSAPLVKPITLCGTMFNLPLLRHRIFETSFEIKLDIVCNHQGTVGGGQYAGVYKMGPRGLYKDGVRVPKAEPGPDWNVAMGIDWMRQEELTQAIPPAYTEYIGRKFLEGANNEAQDNSLDVQIA